MRMAGRKMMTKIKKCLEIGRELVCFLLFPARCPVCDDILEPEEYKKGIHSACKNKLYFISGAVCMHCGRPIGKVNQKEKESIYGSAREYCYDCVQKKYDSRSHIFQAKAVYLYKGAIKTSMYRFKYSNKREYAYLFAKQAVQNYGAWMKRAGIEVIVPVPMYKKKQRRRGYNQAECFARELSKQIGIPVDTNLVRRVADTKPQKGLSESERKNNLKNAFQNIENVVQYRCAIVVDDIYTTGVTAEAVAHELKKIGVRRVYFMSVCIGEDT